MDVAVIGSGPNGLVAAGTLAKLGYKVRVFEQSAQRPGGALGSAHLTLPGFTHDVGAAFFPFASASPAFRFLELEKQGLLWRHAVVESCHVALDGSEASISRAPLENLGEFGSERDTARWHRLADFHGRIEERFVPGVLGPVGNVRPMLSLGPIGLLKLLRLFASSGRGLSQRLFSGDAARRVLPALALHSDTGPDDRFGAAVGYVLGVMATTGGYPVPVGGAQRVADALVRALESHGGRVTLGAPVRRILVRNRRAAAVVLGDGSQISARAVVAGTHVRTVLENLVGPEHVPARALKRMHRFKQGWGTFKMDWALSGPVPWRSETARQSAVVHTGENLDDLSRFTRVVREGRLPERPYLVIGQQSALDPSRAPAGKHTLWAYSRVPPLNAGAWARHGEAFADSVEERIESLAPGFRDKILARNVVTPADLEAQNPNLAGGDIGGGTTHWHQQLLFRPFFPYFRYRMPVKGLYLCSSYAHPGGGVHGMCGYNAARVVAKDLA